MSNIGLGILIIYFAIGAYSVLDFPDEEHFWKRVVIVFLWLPIIILLAVKRK